MKAEPNRPSPFPSPFPGPRPFERGEQKLFFGRDREVHELVSLVTAHRELLVYAESGAGKTSLLNAGLIPALVDEGFQVMPIARVRGLVPSQTAFPSPSNIYVFNTLLSWATDGADLRALATMTLPGFLNAVARTTDENGMQSPRVVIFDQFEELITFYPECWKERQPFFAQISEALEADTLLRVVFVIREDYLANLDSYAHFMPGQLRNRFHLELLRSGPARLAVQGPLSNAGRTFGEGVAELLVEELLKIKVRGASGEIVETIGEFVEPVQLQVICQNLWRDLPPNTTIITNDHLMRFGDVDEALKGFYERTIQTTLRVTRVGERELRNWFQQRLITTAGTRGTVFRGEDRTEGISNVVVDMLENQHLIRAEFRAGARWYELTHDRFIKPVQKSNEVWLRRDRAARERRRKVWLSVGLAGVFLLLIVTLIPLGGYVFLQRNCVAQAEERYNPIDLGRPVSPPRRKVMILVHGAGYFTRDYYGPIIHDVQGILGENVRFIPVFYSDVIFASPPNRTDFESAFEQTRDSYWSYLTKPEISNDVQKRLISALDQAIKDYDDVVIVSHSLGAVVSFDVLKNSANRYNKISVWFTLGSPLAKLRCLGARDGDLGQITPTNIRRWINLYDTDDIFADAILPAFSKQGYPIQDIYWNVAQDPIPAHDYFTNRKTLELISTALR